MMSMRMFLLVALCAAVAAAAAAPAHEEERVLVSEQTAAAAAARGASALETAPALRVRVSPGETRAGADAGEARSGCTDPWCHALCQALNWGGGFCLDEDWCLCYA